MVLSDSAKEQRRKAIESMYGIAEGTGEVLKPRQTEEPAQTEVNEDFMPEKTLREKVDEAAEKFVEEKTREAERQIEIEKMKQADLIERRKILEESLETIKSMDELLENAKSESAVKVGELEKRVRDEEWERTKVTDEAKGKYSELERLLGESKQREKGLQAMLANNNREWEERMRNFSRILKREFGVDQPPV